MPVDVLDDDDRVVDHHAEAEDQGHQADHVDRDAQQAHHGHRPGEGHRDPEGRHGRVAGPDEEPQEPDDQQEPRGGVPVERVEGALHLPERERDSITVHYKQHDTEAELTAQLLIGADGQRSQVRDDTGIAMQHTDYQQVGIIATLTLSEDLGGWAYERFTDTGPIALLPLPAQQASLVWSLSPEQAGQTMHLSDAEFLTACQQAFGYRAGRFVAVRDRVQYPLQLHLADSNISHRSVIIGNASHTLHPIAGQGFNLGVRDAIELSEQLLTAQDPGQYRWLSIYNERRQQDYRRIIGLTDSLVRGFSNQHVPLVVGRNLALFGLDNLPPLRHVFARQTMGFRNA